MLKTVLFDIDGTLLDSNDVHAEAWARAFKEHGYHIPFSDIRPLMGMGGDKVLETLVPGLTDTEGTGKSIADFRKGLVVNTLGPHLKPTPGARDLVLRVKAEGLKAVVATSATDEEMQVLMKAAGVDDLFEEATNSEDAEKSKPSPDILNAALEKSQTRPEEALMIGDTPYDLEAAAQAGVEMVAVRSGGFDHELDGAIGVYDSPADILANFSRTPLARSHADSAGYEGRE